ncbi:MAG TPA: hypothetical protein VFS00_25200, partial [Polyangiaceae bacterium]|nr:hypothetical protein [Polyangiaceae bacterium]
MSSTVFGKRTPPPPVARAPVALAPAVLAPAARVPAALAPAARVLAARVPAARPLAALASAALALAVAGCDVSAPPGSGGVGGAGGGAPGCPQAFVVANSDYASTNVSVVSVAGELLSASLVSSASAGVGSSAALSGDVVLPHDRPASGRVVLLDRYPNA